MKRRSFLKKSALASTALFTPAFLRSNSSSGLFGNFEGKTLVVIQLSGGNDGLNTIVPFENDVYYKERPTIAVSKTEVIRLSDELGLNPALAPLRKLYDDGLLCIINNVGYPNPDRSHFRSMDIWHTASSEEYWNSGWLGRYLDNYCQGRPAYHALEVDDGLSLALKGDQVNGFAMSSAQQIGRAADNQFLKQIGAASAASTGENLNFLYKTLTSTQESAAYLREQSKVKRSSATYPNGKFAEDLRQIAELMIAGTETTIYYVSLGGFDTHAGQVNRQGRLLKEYAGGVAAFVSDLAGQNLLKNTLILTFSEFGRRVRQNASAGTDHGTANNVLVMGGKLRKSGFFNPGPDLSQLNDQDLIYKVDFRNIYASVLQNWLNADAAVVLHKKYEVLNFV
jgi:uncharacterized protein (DUF1501 family)